MQIHAKRQHHLKVKHVDRKKNSTILRTFFEIFDYLRFNKEKKSNEIKINKKRIKLTMNYPSLFYKTPLEFLMHIENRFNKIRNKNKKLTKNNNN